MSLGGNGGILAAYVGAVPEPYRRPSIEEEIRRIRAKAAKHGAGVYGTTRAQRARRLAEIERMTRETGGARRTPRYADGLPGSHPVSSFSPKLQREIRQMIAEVAGRRGIEYR
jgi:hypothetical protein